MALPWYMPPMSAIPGTPQRMVSWCVMARNTPTFCRQNRPPGSAETATRMARMISVSVMSGCLLLAAVIFGAKLADQFTVAFTNLIRPTFHVLNGADQRPQGIGAHFRNRHRFITEEAVNLVLDAIGLGKLVLPPAALVALGLLDFLQPFRVGAGQIEQPKPVPALRIFQRQPFGPGRTGQRRPGIPQGLHVHKIAVHFLDLARR